MRVKIFIFLLSLFSGSIFLMDSLEAQPYYFRHYQVEEGLSNNSVYFIKQDSKGFIWIATKDGLNRFDGFHFKVFRIDSDKDKRHLQTDYIYCVLPIEDGKLWVGAEGGLYKFDPERERLEPFIDSLQNVYDLAFDNSGQLWFISTTTVCRFSFKTNSVTRFPPAEYFNATTLCRGEDGNIWVGTDNGLLKRYDQGKNTFESFDMFSHSKTPSSRWIQKIHAGDNNSIFVGTSSQGLKIFHETSADYEDLLNYNPDKTSIFIRDILKVSDKEYWFATESGIYIYDVANKTFTNLRKKFLDPYSLNDNAIYGLCKDSEGGIWAGTFFGGVDYYAKQNAAFRKYFPDNTGNAISGNAVREICKDQYNNLWIGTEDGGLNEIDSKTKEIRHFKPTGDKSGISYMNIHGLLADGNNLWIGTFEHGIDILDIPTQKVIKHYNKGESGLGSNFALCFFLDKEGKIFVGTANGLYYFNQEKKKFEMPPEIPGNIFVTSIIEDHTNKIWIGTKYNGAFWFDPVSHENGHLQNDSGNKNTLSNNSVNDVYEDSQENIWFATDGGGLSKLNKDRKQFTTITRENGLPGNFVFKVIEDDNKNVWVTTARGLVNFGKDSDKPVIYTQANGLLNNQFNYHSGYKDEDGRLYFGSVKGMISFMPGDFQKNNFIPPVYITGLQVFNSEISPEEDSAALQKSITVADEIKLNHDQSSISIDFSALSYVSPEMIEYKYKLEGLDDDWTNINTNRKAYFTNLSPGKYIFKVKAATNGQWSSPRQLVIRIIPPIWETSWAYLLYGVVIFLLLYYFVRSYHKRQLDKKEREIYESKIDFFTNVAHEIRTPLTLIKGPVDNLLEKKYQLPNAQEDLACLDRNTNRLMDLVSQILDFRQTEIKKFSLDLQKENIIEILRETYLSFSIMAKKRRLDYKLEMPSGEVYAWVDAEALRKIFSNLIGNAVKYAEKKVAVKLYVLGKENKMLFIEFENDGNIIKKEFAEKIFEPFYRIKETENKKGTGIGLTLTKSLVDLHNGNLELTFSKKDSNLFVLMIPVQPENTTNEKPALSVPNFK